MKYFMSEQSRKSVFQKKCLTEISIKKEDLLQIGTNNCIKFDK